MNKKMILPVVLLTAGLLMAGCSASAPLVIGPVAGARIDAELEDEWDEDAPNWQHPDEFAVSGPIAGPAMGIDYFGTVDDHSEYEWDEDAGNWRHADES